MTDRTHRSIWPIFATTLLALVFYVLSIGPFVWVCVRFKLESFVELVYYIYFPILWGCRESETVRELLRWYVLLWVDV